MPIQSKLFLMLSLLIATLFPATSFAEPSEATLRSPLQSASLYIRRHNPTLSEQDAQTLASYVLDNAREFHLDPRLLLAIAKIESRFDPDANNSHGRGLMQVVPRWHEAKIEHAKKRFRSRSVYEPQLNLFVGSWVLRDAMDVSKNVREALSRYNGTLADASFKYANLVMKEIQTIKL